ncbi:hypothetical protein JOQ06_029795, partial [Pogonophryne albipinna]
MTEGGEERGREGREFSILTARWRKLFPSLTVPELRNLLPEGRRLKRLLEGWVESPTMLSALRVRRVLSMSCSEGSEAPMILWAEFTMRCRLLRTWFFITPQSASVILSINIQALATLSSVCLMSANVQRATQLGPDSSRCQVLQDCRRLSV